MWNIIISDDEIIERMITKKVLTDYYKEQCTIFEASNGSEAIALAKRHYIHIAVMDISMPGINGINASKEILKLHPDCMVIFLTAYEDFNYVREALCIHAVDYLLKPCSDEELINAADTAMQTYNNLAQYQKFVDFLKLPAETLSPDMLDPENQAGKNSFDALKIISYIKKNYEKDLSLCDVAARFGYSEVYFCKYFKQNFNVNFTTFLTNLRMDKAKELLKDASINIKAIGNQVGYTDPNYFSKVFKRIVGVSPSEYREAVMTDDKCI